MCGGGGIFNSGKNEQSSAYVTGSETWLDHAATSFANGSGTSSDPYQISTAEELALLSLNSYNGHVGSCFKQTADIFLGQYEWYPIGRNYGSYSGSYHFSGTYDGDGYKISGLKITRSNSLASAGLFGYVGEHGYYSATIKNVNLTNCSISLTGTGSASIYVGGIVGYLDSYHAYSSNVTDCSVEGQLSAELPTASYNNGNSPNVGGIVGYAAFLANIRGCSFNGDVTATDYGYAYAGGIVGRTSSNQTQISQCNVHANVKVNSTGYSSDPCAGGIVGSLDSSAASIAQCAVSGSLYIYGYTVYFGSIAGKSSGNISDCQVNDFLFLFSGVSGNTACGYLVGWLKSGATVTNCSFVGSGGSDSWLKRFNSYPPVSIGSPNTGTTSGCYAVYNNVGYYSGGDFSGWSIVDNFNNGLPVQNNLFAIAPGDFSSQQIVDYLSKTLQYTLLS